jgi:hypothetical protein
MTPVIRYFASEGPITGSAGTPPFVRIAKGMEPIPRDSDILFHTVISLSGRSHCHVAGGANDHDFHCADQTRSEDLLGNRARHLPKPMVLRFGAYDVLPVG